MTWTVLSDNKTNDTILQREHGLCVLLEGSQKILLDTGASDIFISNAKKLEKDLSDVDYVFISHGHSDHGGGLRFLLPHNKKARIIISPHALKGQFYSQRGNLHSITTAWPENAEDIERYILIKENKEIEKGLYVIADIPHLHPMPRGNQKLFIKDGEGNLVHDIFQHEMALYVDGLLFTGCAHSGLENILDACPLPVNNVIGGFHLIDGQESEEELTALGKRLIRNYPDIHFYTSHCTGEEAYNILKNIMGDHLDTFCCGTSHHT